MCARRVRAAILIVLVVAAGALGAWASMRSFTLVRVAGESMHPALHRADVCLIRRGASIRRGDVVLYRAPGHRLAVLHRVIGRTAEGYVTHGDANPIADFDPLPPGAVRGRLIAVLPVGALLERWRGESGGATLHNQSQTARQ